MIVQKRLASMVSRVLNCNLKNIRAKNDTLELIYEDGGNSSKLMVPLVWLRDHCTSKNNYNFATNQRKSNCSKIISQATIKDSMSISVAKNGESIIIDWIDGQRTTFEVGCIVNKGRKREMKSSNLKGTIEMWNSETLKHVSRISKSTLSLQKFSEDLVKYGFVIVDGVEETAEATEKLCQSLVPVHDTFFGRFWVFSNSASEDEPTHEDTAYGNDEIGPHTDGTYFNQTPGIQVFHCLKHAEIGGDTILVDSFYCADKLKNECTESFNILCNTKISHHYLEGSPPGSLIHSVSSEKSVIEIDSKGNITQVRFNPYDRAPFSCLTSSELDAAETIKFYEAYEKFSKLCHDPKNAITISLRPGSVIFIDNFRILHSRTGFRGYRKMCGCYLSRDNFMAKARPFLPESAREFL